MPTLASPRAALPMFALAALSCSSNDGIPSTATAAPPEASARSERPRDAREALSARAESESEAVALSEEMAAPYFARGPAGEAAAAFRLEKWKEARDGFTAALALENAAADAKARARMRLLKGLADSELEAWERAAEALDRAREGLPLLANFIDYHSARARTFAGDLEEAKELAESVEPNSIVGEDAALLLGDILRELGDAEAAAAQYEDYLAEQRGGRRRAEARFRLGEAKEALGEGDAALGHYRHLSIYAPLSEWAEPAADRMDELLAERPDDASEPAETLSGEEHLARGTAYFEGMRNEKAAKDFAAALATESLEGDASCEAAFHRAYAWYRARDRRTSSPLFDEAIELCEDTENENLQVRAAYLAGRSYARIGDHETSIDRHARIEAEHPNHSYADDARLRQAEQYEELEEADKVSELLSTLPELYPEGDMRGEAMWRLAWRAFKDEDYEEAIGWLEAHIESEPIAQNYWAEGQAQYWMGRAYGALGDEESSISAYEDAIRSYPLTYYALLSLNRLREGHESRFEAIARDIGSAPESNDPEEPAFSFEPRPVYGKPGFRRALELLRLGLGESAAAELRRLGLSPPGHRSAVEDSDHAEKLWAVAYLYDRAGQYETSHWPTRYHLVQYKRSWPVGKNRARWRIAYPNAWWEVLDRHASRHAFPTTLQIALVREESAFDPLVESWANAVGLTQLILPTARRFAEGTGLAVSRETLQNPDVNARIGARFLDFLHERFDGHPMLMVPAYNAGEGAVDRWLRRRGDLPADAWVEELGADQPRRYTKRLVGSYFAYEYLNKGRIPALPNELPGR